MTFYLTPKFDRSHAQWAYIHVHLHQLFWPCARTRFIPLLRHLEGNRHEPRKWIRYEQNHPQRSDTDANYISMSFLHTSMSLLHTHLQHTHQLLNRIYRFCHIYCRSTMRQASLSRIQKVFNFSREPSTCEVLSAVSYKVDFLAAERRRTITTILSTSVRDAPVNCARLSTNEAAQLIRIDAEFE